MFYEIILLSVIVTTAWVGPMVLRRSPSGNRTYGWLIVADLLCAVIAFAARRSEGPGGVGDLLGAIAIGAGVFLVLVPPILRGLARRAVARDYLRVARWLIDLRELLQPGMGAREERELLDAFVAVRAGRVDDALAVLEEARQGASDPQVVHQIDERILVTFLSARRWHDAARHYETRLGDPEKTSPQLVVELVRAYCEIGELVTAAELLEWLEDAEMPDEPVVLFLRSRARMVFLAFAGRTSAVEAIVGPGGPLAMLPPAVRHYWAGVARLNAGDRTGAKNELARAAQMSRRNQLAREVVESALASIDRPGVAGPHPIAPRIAELADRVSSSAATDKLPSIPIQGAAPWWKVAPVTTALIACNGAVAVAMWLIYGSTADPGALIRAGANVKSAVAAGEWWRLASSTFLHVGAIHLALNMWALWVLGRLLEQMYGSLRFFPLYVLAGLAGSVASVTLGGAALSAGASGAVLGVLGALVAELALRRGGYPETWRRAMLGPLVFITAAEIGIGFLYPAIDQAAHLGGLAAGAVLATVLSPVLSIARSLAMRALLVTLAVASAAALAGAAWSVATVDYADTLARLPVVEHAVGPAVLAVPGAWEVEDERLVDHGAHIALWLRAVRPGADGVMPGLDAALDHEVRERAREVENEDGTYAERSPRVPAVVPEPWRVRELSVEVDGMAGTQRYRFVLFARQGDGEVWVGGASVPRALADDLAPVLAEILASARPAPPSP